MRQFSTVENPLVGEIKRFISHIPPFNMLDDEDLLLIARSVKVTYHPRREVIFSTKTKEPLRRLFIIFKGAVKLTDPKSMETVELLTAEDIFGVTSLLMKRPPFLDAEALEDTILYEIPEEVIERIFKKNDEFLRFFLAALRSRAAKTSTVRVEKPWFYPLAETEIRDLLMRGPVTCDMKSSIREAVRKMSEEGVSSIIVIKGDRPIGIITDADVKRFIAKGISLDKRVYELMSSPIWSIDVNSSCLDAFLEMLKHNVKHLVVLEGPKLRGVITMRDIMLQEFYNPYYIVRDIDKATSLEELARAKGRMEGLARQLLNRALDFQHISGFITLVTDKLIRKTIQMAISEAGGSPEFSFIGFGSLGREELTIESDIDSGIVYDDDVDEEGRERILKAGKLSIDMLKKIGYLGCEGGFTAENPKWCKPISKWIEFFEGLMKISRDTNLLLLNILLDFRSIYGNETYVKKLRRLVISLFKEKTPFVLLLAKEIFSADLRFDYSAINSKRIKGFLRVIFSAARLLALSEGIEETNTVKRIEALCKKGLITKEERDEILDSYDYLSRLRLELQLEEALGVNKKDKSKVLLDKMLIRESIKAIRKFQGIVERRMFTKYGVTKEWLLSYGIG